MPHRSIPSYQRQNARNLRRAMTDVERKLWEVLHAGRLGGLNFKRQEPIGPYIVDFVCHSAKLVIELDGGQHNEPEHIERDQIRDACLADAGYRVLRFWNFEINSEFEVCLDRIYRVLIVQGILLEASGVFAFTPLPVPQGGRGRLNSDRASGVPSPLEGEGHITHSTHQNASTPVSTP